MNGYSKRTAQKKDAIIKASLTLFNTNGFSKTTIKEIADMAHVSQVTIYNYYSGKESLVYECARFISQDIISYAQKILHSSDPFQTKLTQALCLCQTDAVLSMEKNLSEVALSDPVFLNHLNEGIYEMKQSVFLEYIQAGKLENAISPTLPDDIILQYLMSADNIALNHTKMSEDCAAIQHLILYGLIGS